MVDFIRLSYYKLCLESVINKKMLVAIFQQLNFSKNRFPREKEERESERGNDSGDLLSTIIKINSWSGRTHARVSPFCNTIRMVLAA